MAMKLNQDTSKCSHCARAIPSSNIDLHYAHCVRNLEECKICGYMVPKKQADKHYLSNHAPVACYLCSEVVNRENLDVHTRENCSRRIIACEYCEFPLPATDLSEHQEVCGNRTELCELCQKYVRLCNRFVHEATCTGVQDDTPRNAGPEERERRQQPQRKRLQAFLEKRPLLYTVATTGIAVVLGSLFFLEKNRQH